MLNSRHVDFSIDADDAICAHVLKNLGFKLAGLDFPSEDLA